MNDAKYAAELVKRNKLINAARVSNPGASPLKGLRRESVEVTDRAHRYRAQRNPPQGPKVCRWCDKRLKPGRETMVAHIDGDESNDAASNLAWTCRSCNTRQANRHKALGKGRRTNQMNPYNPSPDVAVLDAVGARLTIAPKIYAALPGMSKRDVDEALGRLYERRAIILHEHTMRSHGDDRARLIHYDGRVWVGSALRTANPAKKEGCTSIGQWSAMMNIVGHKYKGVRYTTATQDEVDSAWAMIMATPPAKRRAWNRQLHGLVRPKEKVPF